VTEVWKTDKEIKQLSSPDIEIGNSMIFLGLDLNKNSTGASALLSDGTLWFSRVFVGGKNYPFDSLELLVEYNKFFSNLVDNLCPVYGRLYVAIEQLNVFSPKLQALTLTLAQISGICVMSMLGVVPTARLKMFHNKTVKKFITGSGNATKEMMINEIEKMYPRPSGFPKSLSSDRADSIAMAYTYLWVWNHRNNQDKSVEQLANHAVRSKIARQLEI